MGQGSDIEQESTEAASAITYYARMLEEAA